MVYVQYIKFPDNFSYMTELSKLAMPMKVVDPPSIYVDIFITIFFVFPYPIKMLLGNHLDTKIEWIVFRHLLDLHPINCRFFLRKSSP